MTDKKSSENRRKLLKSIATGSGAVIAGRSLPESWSRPVVDSVLLPSHAQTSGVCSVSQGCYWSETELLAVSWQGGSGPAEDIALIGNPDCDPGEVDQNIVTLTSVVAATSSAAAAVALGCDDLIEFPEISGCSLYACSNAIPT